MPATIVRTIYCNQCGEEIPADSKFCSVCGAPQAATIDFGEAEYHEAAKDFRDAAIRNELKGYKQLNKGICLECGYQGLVGVSSEYVTPRWKRSISVTAMLLASAFTLLMFHWLVTVLVVLPVCVAVWVKIDRKYRICPSCHNKLK